MSSLRLVFCLSVLAALAPPPAHAAWVWQNDGPPVSAVPAPVVEEAGAESPISRTIRALDQPPIPVLPPDERITPARNVVVTSNEECYAALGVEESLEIRRRYQKPWEECRKRLAIKKKKEQTLKPGEEAAAGDKPAAPKEGGFFRVTDVPPPKKEADNKKESTGEKAATTNR